MDLIMTIAAERDYILRNVNGNIESALVGHRDDVMRPCVRQAVSFSRECWIVKAHNICPKTAN